jgi:hypothetical protein
MQHVCGERWSCSMYVVRDGHAACMWWCRKVLKSCFGFFRISCISNFGSKHESCLSCTWVMSLLYMSHVSLVHLSCLACTWVMSLLYMRHDSLVHESCLSCTCIMSLVYMSHVSLVHDSCLSCTPWYWFYKCTYIHWTRLFGYACVEVEIEIEIPIDIETYTGVCWDRDRDRWDRPALKTWKCNVSISHYYFTTTLLLLYCRTRKHEQTCTGTRR